jgi:nucleolin
MDYLTVVELPEEAKVYVGNLPCDVDNEGLTQLFEQASITEVRLLSHSHSTLGCLVLLICMS